MMVCMCIVLCEKARQYIVRVSVRVSVRVLVCVWSVRMWVCASDE